jgi:tRNA threonylcarbamoyl adenosine modification protein YeaZ
VLILGIDAALARCSAAVIADGVLRAERREEGERAKVGVLPVLVQAVLADAGVEAVALDGIAVTVGPGSFTGLRAALAMAHGIGLATGRPVVGVTVAEALAEAVPGRGRGRLWVAIDSRRGRVFLHTGGEGVTAVPLGALPPAKGPVILAGDAAPAVVARLLARGEVATLADARLPLARHVALVGARRLAGALAPLPAQPLYVDAPAAVEPAGGLRPAPVGG